MGPLFFLALFTGLSFAQIEEHFLDVTITTNIILIDTAYLKQQPASFGAPIGANTQWLTEENGVTKWIGVNTEHLTQLTSTTVDEQGSPVTTTQDVKATIVGEPPVDGILGQDLSVIITPAFLNEINTIKSELCVGGARKRALSCGIEFVDKIAATFDIYAGAEAAKWAGAGGALVVGGMFAAQAKKIAEGGGDIPLNMNINKDDFNKAKPVITKIITITKSNTVSIESSTASSTSSDLGAGGGKDPQETGLPGADCWLYTGSTPDTSNVDDSEDPDSDDEVSSLKIRRLAGRITYDPSLLDSRETPTDISSNPADLAKRALENLGNCPQTFPANFKASFMPGVKGIAKIPKDLWWWVPLPQTDAAGLCTISTLQKVPDDQVGGTPPVPIGYVQDPNAAGKKVSVDHIYEKSFLKDFFLSVFKDANDPRCQPFFDLMLQNSKYVNPTYPGKDKGSRIQLLFNLQPNVQNGAFLGLERNINSVKGSLMNPGLVGIQAVDERKELDATDKNLNLLNDIAMAWSVLKIPAAAEKMKTINNNIYRAFIAIDKLESCAPIKGGGNGPNAQTWASAYQDWISAFFRDRQAETIAYVTKIKQTIEAAPMTLTEAGGQEKNKFGRAFNAINAAFPDEHWVLDTASLLDFSGDAIETIQKRDSSIIGFPGCDNPPPGQASSVVSSSPTPTPSALCVVRTLVDCIYQYEDRPDLSIADCPPIPPLPASCGGGGAAATSAPSPSPTPVPQPPVLGPQGCYASESHEDVHGNVVNDDAGRICSEIWKTGEHATMDANTVAKTFNPNSWFLSSNNYWYGVGWIVGCQTTATTQLVGDPLADGNKDHACPKLLSNNWGNCNNGGTGGWIDAGCLRYTFKASKNKLTDNWDGVVKIS